jgi:hypothetical protein
MRNVLAIAAAVGFACLAHADDRADGRQTGKDVQSLYGSGDALEQRAFAPLTSGTQMTTVDESQSFDTKVSCDAQEAFMQVTIVPSSDADVQFIGVDSDRDLNGSYEVTDGFAGPFAAVCTNGVLQCTPGTTTNCQGHQWAMSGSSLVLNSVDADQLGGCYCFNQSCGAGLLSSNSEKVLKDIGLGIANVLDDAFPRLAVGHHQAVDGQTMLFSGQSCANDPIAPEQYYSNPNDIEAAGQAEGSDTNSLYYKLTHGNLADGKVPSERSCLRHRQVVLTDTAPTSDIFTVSSSDPFSQASCGANCIEFVLGRQGDNYLGAYCGRIEEQAQFVIKDPSRIVGVRYKGATIDDWISVKFNGNVVWSSPAGWDGTADHCGENGSRGSHPANIDITSIFTGVSPGGTVQWVNTVMWRDKGEGWSTIQLTYDPCGLGDEYIEDGCPALESDGQCTLREEQVDGVYTYENYYGTGLRPVPSSRTITSGACSQSFTRDWWEAERTYECQSTASEPFDGSAAEDRYRVIHNSFDPETGDFDDRRDDGNGYATYGESMTLPPDDPSSCIAMCKTRQPRPGVSVGEGGATSGSAGESNAGQAWDYTFYECDTDNVCPAPAGETVVEPCACGSSFMEAFGYMQTIRQAQQDFICN